MRKLILELEPREEEAIRDGKIILPEHDSKMWSADDKFLVLRGDSLPCEHVPEGGRIPTYSHRIEDGVLRIGTVRFDSMTQCSQV